MIAADELKIESNFPFASAERPKIIQRGGRGEENSPSSDGFGPRGSIMNHAGCRELYDYWDRLRGADTAPARELIDPASLRRVLADTFLLSLGQDNMFRFRLAGTRICTAYCRELKDHDFLADFTLRDRDRLRPMLTSIADHATPVIMTMNTWNRRGERLAFEAVLLPLRQRDAGFGRILGMLGASERPSWLGTLPIVGQEITGIRLIDARRRDSLSQAGRPLAPPPGTRGRPALVVLEGGKR